MRKLHFLSGLPRSGGSLLGELLEQDPDVTVAPENTACHEILYTIRNNWKIWKEHQTDHYFASDEALQKVLFGVLASYTPQDTPIFFDKGRSWLSLIELAQFALNREPRIIVPVRTIKNIVASMELAYRDNLHKSDYFAQKYDGLTLAGRVAHLTSEKGTLGIAYRRIQDAIQRGLGHCLFLVDYDDLIRDPGKSMAALWEWLDMDAPEHDFSIIKQTHDNLYAERVLGEEICQDLDNLEFWRTSPGQRQTI